MKFAFLTILIAVGLTYIGVAHAQDTQVVVGDLIAPWLEMLMGAFAILITAIIGWIAAQIKAKTGIDIEARHREALQVALTNGAGLILNSLGRRAKDITFDVKHPAIASGVKYVMEAVPDAVDNFGLRPEQLAEKLVAKLGLATAPADTDKPGTLT